MLPVVSTRYRQGRLPTTARKLSIAPDATLWEDSRHSGQLSKTMKTPKKQSQCQRLLAYLKKHRKGITTMEAFDHLRITCVHKRISELEDIGKEINEYPFVVAAYKITRTPERTASGARIIRYKLAR